MKSLPDLPLSAKARKFVAERIASGKNDSPKEVVEDALNLLQRVEREQQAQLQEIRSGVRRGIEAADRGELLPLDGVLDRVRARVAARSRSARRKKSA